MHQTFCHFSLVVSRSFLYYIDVNTGAGCRSGAPQSDQRSDILCIFGMRLTFKREN
jgi:hypothetical protein